MSKRSAKFVAALFAGVMAGANLATVTDLRAQAASSRRCLSAPKGATSPGSHWYYRIDRVTKRQCWYLREEATGPATSPPRRAASFSTGELRQPRSRLSSSSRRDDDTQGDLRRARRIGLAAIPRRTDPPAKVEPQTTGAAAAAPAVPNSRAAQARMCSRRRRCPRCDGTTARRECFPQSCRSPDRRRRQPARRPAEDAGRSSKACSSRCDRSDCARRSGCVAPAKPTASLQKLLMVMAAALALAGLTVSAIVRIGRMRARRAMRRKRRAMWDSAKTKRPAPQPTFGTADAGAPPARSAPPTRSTPSRADTRRTGRPRARTEAVPQERRACLRSGARPPQERASACPRIGAGTAGYGNAVPARPQRAELTETDGRGYFSSWRCRLRTNSVRPVRRSRLSRSALRIDCTSANASSTLWLTTI